MFDKLNVLTRIIEKVKRFPVTFEGMLEWVRYENIEISERTLYRYLKEIETLRLNDGHIITLNGDFNKKTWKFEYDNSDNELKEDDIMSLWLLKGLFPKSFAQHRKTSINKIEEIVYKNHSKSKFEYHLQPLSENEVTASSFGEYAYTAEEQENINQIIWAIIHRRKIKILHAGSGNELSASSIGEIVPMQVTFHKGTAYLMCLSAGSQKLHAIDITQFAAIEILNTPFDIKKYEASYNWQLSKRFGVQENISENDYEIVLHFAPAIGRRVCQKRWHMSQKAMELPDGRWEMKFYCGINNELINWIIQWNKHVEILKPAILICKISEQLSYCIKSHRQLFQ